MLWVCAGVCLGIVVVEVERILWIRECVFVVENVVEYVKWGYQKGLRLFSMVLAFCFLLLPLGVVLVLVL